MRHVVLLGLMGAGKTTVGHALAAALGWPLVDSDAEIEATTGRSVRELRDELGTEAMHRLEAEQLLRALAASGPDIVAAAASVVDDVECRARLLDRGVVGVWLRVPPEVLAARFASGLHRPSFGDDPAAFLADQAERREPQFAAVARLVVDVGQRDPSEVATEIVRRLVE